MPSVSNGLQNGLLVQVESACQGSIWIYTVAEGSMSRGRLHTAVGSWEGILVTSAQVVMSVPVTTDMWLLWYLCILVMEVELSTCTCTMMQHF